jgi:hypothetical protein
MPDPRAWLDGLSAPVTVGWVVWLVWSLALVGWYRYALVAPKAAPRAAAPRPPAFPARSPDADPLEPGRAEPFSHEAGVNDPGSAPAQIDWSTAATAPAMRAPRRPADAAPAPAPEAAAAQAPASSYQFTTHRQDEVLSQR